MHIDVFLFGMLVVTFVMVIAKRITALISGFCLQSFFLFLTTLSLAVTSRNIELFIVAGLLFLIKVILVPLFLRSIVKKMNVDEDLGLFVNPVLSIFIALLLTHLTHLLTSEIIPAQEQIHSSAFNISLAVTTIGLFVTIVRMKALAQIIGLLVMENGLFVSAAAVSGGMPFFVEIAIFFDIFVCVIILGVFVYRINRLFAHIDVSKLTRLRG